ncbi:actin-binding LIM protein 1-like isoform X2 [Diaphorina citri]|uniref:Actin-binding LIM protein 1-like isoform X2 n=1 Tax=Diaphorina citri TaxID=121845 RepID=A0A3Q0JNY0_DIACI|nr:actin-binding LIM protein 1-like isoform X2 [Diaphorina citri]
MGVYEGLGPGMHWQAQTHPPSVQSCGRIISTPLYDPSRNSSPNLPCGQQEPMNPSQTQLLNNNPSCCNFKREYNRGDNCHDCSQNNMYAARCNSTPSGEERKYSDLLEPKQEPTNLDSDEAANVTCAGCSRKIVDRFYLYAVDQRWHVSCLQCSQCGRTLDGEMTCFCKDGTIYCKNDYYRYVMF